MAEGKRKRPTVGQVREMEDVIHRQCVELNAWRSKYRALVNRGLWARIFNRE